jgi:hypothetical protein
MLMCSQQLERVGGVFGCCLPAGHPGDHSIAPTKRHIKAPWSTEFADSDDLDIAECSTVAAQDSTLPNYQRLQQRRKVQPPKPHRLAQYRLHGDYHYSVGAPPVIPDAEVALAEGVNRSTIWRRRQKLQKHAVACNEGGGLVSAVGMSTSPGSQHDVADGRVCGDPCVRHGCVYVKPFADERSRPGGSRAKGARRHGTPAAKFDEQVPIVRLRLKDRCCESSLTASIDSSSDELTLPPASVAGYLKKAVEGSAPVEAVTTHVEAVPAAHVEVLHMDDSDVIVEGQELPAVQSVQVDHGLSDHFDLNDPDSEW